jgi:hypothetical protein
MTEPIRNFKSAPSWCRNRSVFATPRVAALSAQTAVKVVLTLVVLAGAMLAAGCEQDQEFAPVGVIGGAGPGLIPDVSFVDADTGPEDRPLQSFCVAGERRCLFEMSPLFEECSPDAQSFDLASCGPAQMCRAGLCVDFSCTPGSAICVGTQSPAQCADDGRSFRGLRQCAGRGDVCRSGECIDTCEAAERERSYIGCEYLARELPNRYRMGGAADNSPFAVVVANPDRLLDARVTITTPDGELAKLIEELEVRPDPEIGYKGDPVTVRSELLTGNEEISIASPAEDVVIPPQAAAVFLLRPLRAKMHAYRVESTRPIIASQFSPYCCNFTFSNDASLLLPTTALGKRYRVLSYPSMVDMVRQTFVPATFTVVANRDGTVVDINSPVDLLQSRDGFPRDEFEGGQVHLQAGESITFGTATSFHGSGTKNRDLSGALVESNEPIAVFAGHECTFVPQDEWACDHIEEQMLPAETLGSRYLLTPTRKRGPHRQSTEKIYWRIVADEDSTVRFSPPLDELIVAAPSNDATLDCRQEMSDGALRLEAGQVCEFGVLSPVAVESSGALLIGGVISGHQSTGQLFTGARAGDPSFFLVPPVEQFRQDYSFVSPPTYAGNYVAVAVPQGGSVALDGVAIPDAARLELRQAELDGTTWDFYNVAVEAGYHTMKSEQPFGIVVYAYDDYVSYAFPVGLDLKPKGSR